MKVRLSKKGKYKADYASMLKLFVLYKIEASKKIWTVAPRSLNLRGGADGFYFNCLKRLEKSDSDF